MSAKLILHVLNFNIIDKILTFSQRILEFPIHFKSWYSDREFEKSKSLQTWQNRWKKF